MALQGCIGDSNRFVRWSARRYLLISGDLEDGPVWEALDRLYKETHEHDGAKQPPRRGLRIKPTSPKLKWCNGCEDERPRNEFSVDRSRKDGLNNRCKLCAGKYLKQQLSRLCGMCGFISWGATCLRCYRWAIVVRDAEREAISIIPAMLAKKEAELLEPLSMAQKNAYHEAKKLRNKALAIR